MQKDHVETLKNALNEHTLSRRLDHEQILKARLTPLERQLVKVAPQTTSAPPIKN